MEKSKSKKAPHHPDWSFVVRLSPEAFLERLHRLMEAQQPWELHLKSIEQIASYEYQLHWYSNGRYGYDVKMPLYLEPLSADLTLVYGYRYMSGWFYILAAAGFFLMLPLFINSPDAQLVVGIIGVLWLPGLLLAWFAPESMDTACSFSKNLRERLSVPVKQQSED